MEDKGYVIPQNKNVVASILFVCILLGVGMLILVSRPFSEPEDLVQVSCSFDSYEIKQHTRSISYDLFLISDAYDKPFQMPFFDGYKHTLYPEDFCTGKTYTLMVLPNKSYYTIYSCFDAHGNCIMTKSEAYTNSQHTAHISLVIMLHLFIGFFGVMLLIIHRPDLFSDRVKKFFFGKRKSI